MENLNRTTILRMFAEHARINFDDEARYVLVDGRIKLGWFNYNPRIYRCLLCGYMEIDSIARPVHLHEDGVEGIMQEVGTIRICAEDLPTLGPDWYFEGDRLCFKLPEEK